ncbi:uncharacterized protein LOC105701844 [Orussus abietinus]|uniref:uncharacterized protein LOC105701844 n=1 Tax=Orussus abietinus TaxID=222816 RepID=UPI000C716182|nr:uncharacterized protein LOC105701844 [Orussus abietinus]
MLRRKRGVATRKMTKRVAPAALQTEVGNDEEWHKVLERSGLLVVDVYSEWSGPCTAMVSVLKKVKMEIGGDTLSYAIAKSDNISDLERFRGNSEPTWMFIHGGQMVNLMFGANCPQLYKMLITELERVQNEEPHDFCIPVTQMSPEEQRRMKIYEKARLAKEAVQKAQREADAVAKYEAEMSFYMDVLHDETCLILYPWVFKDDDGLRRNKKDSPPYVELTEEILPEHYTIEEQFKKPLDDPALSKLFLESNYEVSAEEKKLLLDGKCLLMRLKICVDHEDVDVEKFLLSLLFGEPVLPDVTQPLPEGCFAEKHSPAYSIDLDDMVFSPVAWAPPSPRSKVTVFRTIFRKYLELTHPYEDKAHRSPVIVFKYDSTRKNDLKVVMEMYESEIVNFGVFDRDKPPSAKQIADSIEEFETLVKDKSGYEVFVCVVKRIGSEAFLTFAGIGPYHVSDGPEKGLEESKLYFPVYSSDEEQTDEEQQEGEGEETELV